MKRVSFFEQESGVPRDELFLATKMWPRDYGYETGLGAAKSSLAKLDTDYLGKEWRPSAYNCIEAMRLYLALRPNSI